MAHVYRPTYTRAIPANAARCTHKGKAAVRWKGRGGKWVVGVISETNPSRCRVESSVWHVSYKGPNGETLDAAGYADRAATEALMSRLVTRSARVAAGVLPPEAAATKATLAELLAEWGRHLRDSGVTARHADDRPRQARRIAEQLGAASPADLTPAAVVRAAAAVRRTLNLSEKTAGYHVSAAKQFTRWLAVTRRSEPADHLSALPRPPAPTRQTFTRRSLAPAEFVRLVAAARGSRTDRRGLTGPERAVLYIVAASTGLRAAELAALTPASFDLARGTVTATAAVAKGRRTDELPLGPDVVAELRALLRNAKAGARVWPRRCGRAGGSVWGAWWAHAAEMLRGDLAEAGIDFATAEGVFDFHALRGQFATDLERAGVGLAAAQKLMRHSSPVLTAKHYIKRSAAELAAEVAKVERVRRKAD